MSGLSTAEIRLKGDDEFAHAPDGHDDAPWKDTWWFVLRDPERDVAVHAHLTCTPMPHPGVRAAVVVIDGARQAATVTNSGWSTGNEIGNDLLGVEVVDSSWDERKRLRLHVRMPELTGEFDLTGAFPAADINVLCPGVMPVSSGGPPGPSAQGHLRHIEQAMAFEGTLRWAHQEPVTLRGSGIRDRSWGWRRTEAMFRFGWDGFFGTSSDYAVGLCCYQADFAPSAGEPRVSAWYADSGGVHGCTGGELRLDGTGRLALVGLKPDGRDEYRALVRQHGGCAFFPAQDPAPDERTFMLGMREHHVDLRDAADSAVHGLYTTGRPIWSSLLENARFCR